MATNRGIDSGPPSRGASDFANSGSMRRAGSNTARHSCAGSAARPTRARFGSVSSSNSRCKVRRAASIARSALAATLLAAAGWARAAEPPMGDIAATPATIRAFMIQNVCLDAGGAVLVGHNPAEGDPACIPQRDLRPGEPLPYHKHDHPSPGAGLPNGYQRHDSFPVETVGLGHVGDHSFDL